MMANRRARGHVQPRQRAPQQADRFAHEPVRAELRQLRIDRKHGIHVALRAQHPQADVEMVVAQHQDRVVQLARDAQRGHHAVPALRTLVGVRGLRALRPLTVISALRATGSSFTSTSE